MPDPELNPTGPQAGAAQKTVSQVLGEVTWLMTQSPTHRQLFIADLEWFAMPALLLEQFRIFSGPQHPVGLALWARVSPETESRLQAGAHKLRADEWRSGDKPWMIELVAPFGAQDEMIKDLAHSVFPDESFRFHKLNADGERVVVDYDAHIQADQNTNGAASD